MILYVLFLAFTGYSLSIIQGPQVGNNRINDFTVGWQTDSLSESRLEWGLSAEALTLNASRDSLRKWHVVKAAGLLPETFYYYRVVSWSGADTARSVVYRTKTAVQRDTPFRFQIITDPHGGSQFSRTYNGNPATRYRASEQLLKDSADLFICTGDIAGNNTNNIDTNLLQLRRFKKNTDSVEHSVPMYECFGNHDASPSMERVWANTDTTDYGFILPEENMYLGDGFGKGHFYSFDYGTAHFVIADLREDWPRTGALAWLIADLQAARARGMEHKFIFSHYSLVGMEARSGATPYHNNYWWSGSYYRGCASNQYHVLDSLGVEAWFHGHWHSYCRYRVHPRLYPGFDTLWMKEKFGNQVLFLTCGQYGGGGYDLDTVTYVQDFYTRAYSTMVVQCDVNFRQVTIYGRNHASNLAGSVWTKAAVDSFKLRPDAPESLTAATEAGGVRLRWRKTSDGTSIYGVGGYHIYRSGVAWGDARNTARSGYSRIATLPSPDSVSFLDIDKVSGPRYYVVTAFDTNFSKREGNYSNEAATDVNSHELSNAKRPGPAALSASPNPFNPATHISIGIPAAVSGKVKLTVMDARGREIVVLNNAPLHPGHHGFAWNGADNRGRPVSTGVYLIELRAARFMERMRVVLIK